MLNSLRADALRPFWRTVRRSPGKLLFLLISLGLSFGFVAAAATLAHATWFRLPAGVAAGDYISLSRQTPSGHREMSLDHARHIRETMPEMQWFHVRRFVALDVATAGGTRDVYASLVSGNFFDALGVEPALGVLRSSRDGPAAVLSDALWRELFAAGRDAIGESLRIAGGMDVPIIGVASPAFRGIASAPDAWILDAPYNLQDLTRSPEYSLHQGEGEAARELFRKHLLWRVFGRASEDGGADPGSRARAALAGYEFDTSPAKIGDTTIGFGARDTDRLAVSDGLEMRPAQRSDTRRRMVWLLCIVALLLAVAFLSLMDFLMAENLARDEELAVRVALGASQWDVFRRALAENALWIAAVAALGALSSGYALDVLLGVAPFSEYIGAAPAASRLLGLGIGGVLLAAAFLSGVAYASHFASRSARSLVAARARRPQWLARASRGALLFAALASLLAAFSLAGRYWGDTRHALPIGNADALIVRVQVPIAQWMQGRPDPIDGSALTEALAAIPGVESAAMASMLPLSEAADLETSAGELRNEPSLAGTVFYAVNATWGLFRALGMELLAGRLPAADDEVVLSRSAAVTLAGSAEAALGRPVDYFSLMVKNMGVTLPPAPKTVVGVVEDVPYGDYAAARTRIVYMSGDDPIGRADFAIAHRGDADAIVRAARALPAFERFEVAARGTFATRLRAQFLARRSVEILLAAAGAFVFSLALAGVANALARGIAAQRRGIGIRLALGAPQAAVLRGHAAPVIGDLLLMAALAGAAALAAKLAGGALATLLDIRLLVPAALCLAALCVVVCHMLIRQLARRRSLGALVREG